MTIVIFDDRIQLEDLDATKIVNMFDEIEYDEKSKQYFIPQTRKQKEQNGN